ETLLIHSDSNQGTYTIFIPPGVTEEHDRPWFSPSARGEDSAATVVTQKTRILQHGQSEKADHYRFL
ncbi:MAG TPA: hypothetical protein PK916_17225, partial [Bacteroidota bacterium]|nr:hypothetical protein [Bacteroidota bacterium]